MNPWLALLSNAFITVAYFSLILGVMVVVLWDVKRHSIPDAYRTWADVGRMFAIGLFYALPAAVLWFLFAPVASTARIWANDQFANVLIRGLTDTMTPELFVSLHGADALWTLCVLLACPLLFALVVGGFDVMRRGPV